MAFDNRPHATASIIADSPVARSFSEDFEGPVVIGDSGWDVWSGTAAISGADFHSGTKSLKLSTTNYEVYVDLERPELDGAQVEIKFWIKAPAGAILPLWYMDIELEPGSDNEVTMTGSWQEVTVTGTMHSPWISLWVYDDSSTFDVFIDDFTIDSNNLSPRLSLADGDLTLDSSRYPFAESAITMPMVDEDLLELIKPGQRVVLNANEGTSNVEADLVLRKREVSHDGKTISLDLASDEAILATWADVEDDATPRDHEANLRDLIDYVLAKAIPGAALQPGSDNADVTARWDAENLVPNPTARTIFGGWTTGGNNGTILRSTGGLPSSHPPGATTHLRATFSGNSGLGEGGVWARTATQEPYTRISAHRLYSVSAWATVPSGSKNVRLQVRPYDASGAPISGWYAVAHSTLSTSWQRIAGTYVAPTGAARLDIRMTPWASEQWTNGQQLDAGMFMVIEGASPTDPFDGSTPLTTGYSAIGWDGDVDASTSFRLATVERLPELFTWRAGQSAWDFLSPLVASAGLRLFCDEKRHWWLIDPSTYRVPGRFSARTDNAVQGTDTMDADDENNGITGVVARFSWRDALGESRSATDSAGVAGKVKVLEFNTAPSPGVAAAHLAKVQGQNRTQDVTVATDYTIRPGQEIQIDLPGTYAQLGTLTRVKWELITGLMSLGSAGLRETPPGSIDLLPGTIDSLTGTINDL